MIISLTGFMGSGKSSVGAALSSILNFRFIDLDDYVQKREGQSIAQMFSRGEECFREAESRCLREILAEEEENTVLALGGGTVAYGQNLPAILSLTKCVYLQTSIDVIERRLSASSALRPMYDPETVEDLYESRLQYYEQAEFTVDTDNLTPAGTANLIAELISGKYTD